MISKTYSSRERLYFSAKMSIINRCVASIQYRCALREGQDKREVDHEDQIFVGLNRDYIGQGEPDILVIRSRVFCSTSKWGVNEAVDGGRQVMDNPGRDTVLEYSTPWNLHPRQASWPRHFSSSVSLSGTLQYRDTTVHSGSNQEFSTLPQYPIFTCIC